MWQCTTTKKYLHCCFCADGAEWRIGSQTNWTEISAEMPHVYIPCYHIMFLEDVFGLEAFIHDSWGFEPELQLGSNLYKDVSIMQQCPWWQEFSGAAGEDEHFETLRNCGKQRNKQQQNVPENGILFCSTSNDQKINCLWSLPSKLGSHWQCSNVFLRKKKPNNIQNQLPCSERIDSREWGSQPVHLSLMFTDQPVLNSGLFCWHTWRAAILTDH